MGSDYESAPNAIRQMVVCHKCGKKYLQVTKPQAHYGSKVGMDICPYCSAINKKSYEFLFQNYKAKQED